MNRTTIAARWQKQPRSWQTVFRDWFGRQEPRRAWTTVLRDALLEVVVIGGTVVVVVLLLGPELGWSGLAALLVARLLYTTLLEILPGRSPFTQRFAESTLNPAGS